MKYRRSETEWRTLAEAGRAFLEERARLQTTTSYTEMNTVLASRTGLRPFDFDRDDELHGQVASGPLRSALDLLRGQLVALVGTGDPFEIIDGWRNQSLHGAGTLPTIGGTLLSVISLVALDGLKDKYDELSAKAVKRVRWELQTNSALSDFPPSSFYAPVPIGARLRNRHRCVTSLDSC